MSLIKSGLDILLSDGPIQFVKRGAEYTEQLIGRTLSCGGYLGTNIFTKDWDLLIILDTCRVDALRRVAPEYDFLTNIKSMNSVGATSQEWMNTTFTQKYVDDINNTAYLANNGFAGLVLGDESYRDSPQTPPRKTPFCEWDSLDSTDFGRLEHIYKYSDTKNSDERFHPDVGYVPPEYVTDRGVAVGREYDYERVILHYCRPHHPYFSNAIDEDRELKSYETRVFEYLKNGGEKQKVFNAYLDDLRYVLDQVDILLENYDAETVAISADHGEAFGEYGIYSHPFGSIHPHVRRVPWAITSAKDEGLYTPQLEPIEDSQRDVNKLLSALGYR